MSAPGRQGARDFGNGPGLGAVLRRKAAGGREIPAAAGEAPVLRALRRALARAAQADCRLPVAAGETRQREASLAELLEMPEDMALLAVLEGPGERLGLMALGPAVTAALIEQHTTGMVSGADPAPRKPTRTDAAIAAGLIDRTMAELETGLAGEAGAAASAAAAWIAGYRYASFLDDPRPLGLLLEDIPYEVVTATVDLAGGARRGGIMLALPAASRRKTAAARPPAARHAAAGLPAALPSAVPPAISRAALAQAAAGPAPPAATVEWRERMSRTVMASPTTLGAVLCRLKLPLAAVMGWQPGDFVMLPGGTLDRVTLEGLGGRPLARACLGQSRGTRALRLVPPDAEGGGPPSVTAVRAPATLAPAGPPVGRRPSASVEELPPFADLGDGALATLPDLGDLALAPLPDPDNDLLGR